jgi:hypothetical protein
MRIRVPPSTLRYENFREKELLDLLVANNQHTFQDVVQNSVLPIVHDDLILDHALVILLAVALGEPEIEVWNENARTNDHVEV